MSWNLHVAHTYKIKYDCVELPVPTDKMHSSKSSLCLTLRIYPTAILPTITKLNALNLNACSISFTQTEKSFRNMLKSSNRHFAKPEMNRDEFLACLDKLINNSDQTNEYVYLAWY